MAIKMTCIYCPVGCELEIEIEDGEVKVRGNRCPRGCEYAKQELLEPKRVLFTVVRVDSEEYRVCAVRSREPIPKDKIREAVDKLSKMKVPSGVKRGDVIAKMYGTEIVVTRA